MHYSNKEMLYLEEKVVLCMETLHFWEDKNCLVQPQKSGWIPRPLALDQKKEVDEDAEQVIEWKLLQKCSRARKEIQNVLIEEVAIKSGHLQPRLISDYFWK